MTYTDWDIDLVDVRSEWDDAPLEDDALSELVQAAWIQCWTYAPTLPEGTDAPDSYRLAVKMQARALWRSTVSNGGNTLGGSEFGVTVFPLDWTVKALLRPKRGKPVLR